MSASRNLGAAHATAPYIAFLDADDVWMPDKLAEQVDLLERMPDVAMVCGAAVLAQLRPGRHDGGLYRADGRDSRPAR
jgi:glycosyltransferase involved in cell wall biosynthesis